jgi:hypothetical protein
MMEESSSFVPALVKTAPLPALKSGESSMSVMAATTASRQPPPFCSTPKPASRASVSLSR